MHHQCWFLPDLLGLNISDLNMNFQISLQLSSVFHVNFFFIDPRFLRKKGKNIELSECIFFSIASTKND